MCIWSLNLRGSRSRRLSNCSENKNYQMNRKKQQEKSLVSFDVRKIICMFSCGLCPSSVQQLDIFGQTDIKASILCVQYTFTGASHPFKSKGRAYFARSLPWILSPFSLGKCLDIKALEWIFYKFFFRSIFVWRGKFFFLHFVSFISAHFIFFLLFLFLLPASFP